MKLIASKSMTYATRRLSAGDLFTATPRDARILVALQRARLAGDVPTTDDQPKAKPKRKAPQRKRPQAKAD